MIRIKGCFFPVFLLVLSWGGTVLVREFSFVSFDNISYETILYLSFFFSCFLIGSLLGPFFSRNIPSKKLSTYRARDVQFKANCLLFFAVVANALLLVKFFTLLGTFSFSLADITDLRLSRGRDASVEKANLVSGVLGMALSGFSIICYIYKEFFREFLDSRKQRLLIFAFVLGVFTSFLSGGRWAAAIALVVVFFVHKVNDSYLTSVQFKRKESKGFKTTFIRFVFVGLVLYVFSLIFINRVAGDDGGTNILLSVLNERLEGISVPIEHEKVLLNNEYLTPIYFVISLFQYYIGHAIYQFEILYLADYPTNAPYLLAYQGYLYTTLFNKVGLDIIPIQSILNEIVNPGVYFTLAGAFYLDFGFWGAGLVIFILAIIGSYFWARFIRKRSFFDLYISLLFFILIVFSPIVAITSTGVYPSLLTLLVIVPTLIPKKLVTKR